MRRYVKIIGIVGILAVLATGCGKKNEPQKEIVDDFEEIVPTATEPVIVRDEQSAASESTEESEEPSEPETEIVPYADRVAGENVVTYEIETAAYEEGVVKITYPQLVNMDNQEKQQRINESIKNAVTHVTTDENLSSYELRYETATKGAGMVSFIFRGTSYYEGAAYPNNMIKTLNIDLNTEKNVRLKDFADLSAVVSGLEMAEGYQIVNEGVELSDFSAFLNNGSVTDYAITLLDFDLDLANPDLRPAGFSAIRENHLVLFIEAEHAMGDYVELEFQADL